MRNPYHKPMHRSRVIPMFECIVPTFFRFLKIAKALDFTVFQRFIRPIGRTNKENPRECVIDMLPLRETVKNKTLLIAKGVFLWTGIRFQQM